MIQTNIQFFYKYWSNCSIEINLTKTTKRGTDYSTHKFKQQTKQWVVKHKNLNAVRH